MRTLPPRKIKNSLRRPREYLTESEVERLINAARQSGRYSARDAAMVLLAARHGLRVSELVSLKWSQVDLTQGLLHVTRLKRGLPSTHPLWGPELRALRRLRREYPDTEYIFMSERKAPMTASNFRKIMTRIGRVAELEHLLIHPHMLRHATGFKLSNDDQSTRSIQCYLGHKNIQHTVHYTQIVPKKFRTFWQD
jgi:type 1 fimbriae regulatory protein FimB/type 1 fimbriae regulatory protein FimE